MHQVLDIAELRLACTSHLAEHPRELSRLARTNKEYFRDPALDLLYKSVPNLMVLLARFPPRTVEIVDNSKVCCRCPFHPYHPFKSD